MGASNQSVGTPYVFGFSEEEIQRLQRQAQLLAPSMQRLLNAAGVTAGMKVLDIGSGAGDVAFIAAQLVGPTGTVVGVDKNPAIVSVSRARAQAAGLTNVTFIEGEITDLKLDTDFDALLGRYILQHLKEPTAVLRKLVRHLHPGGIVAFQEADLMHLGDSVPSVPLFERVASWVKDAMRGAHIDLNAGLRLYHQFLEAGLPAPQMHCETFVSNGPDWPWYDVIAARVESLLPLIQKFGIATAEEVDIATLAQRLRDEVSRQQAVVMAPDMVSAWTRTQ